MKIAHVEAGRHLYGGAQQVAYIVAGLQQRGHEQCVICPAGAAIGAEARGLGITVWEIGPNGDFDLGFACRFRRALAGWRPDLVHLHSRRGADSVALWAARRAGLPVVLSRRVDNPEPRWLAGWRYRRCDRVIAISDGIAAVLRSAGVDPGRLRVVRSTVPATPGAPLPAAAARAALDIEDGVLAVGVVAQLIGRKGHRVLFEALQSRADWPPLRVLVFGQGPEEAALRAEVARRGLQGQVRFMGFREDLDTLWRALDLLVHPALMEGLGVALLKAQAMAVPVLASAAGGIPEAVADGVSGVLVPPGDVAALAAALHRLLSDTELRSSLATAAPAHIAAHFSLDAMVEGNLAVYEELVAGSSKR